MSLVAVGFSFAAVSTPAMAADGDPSPNKAYIVPTTATNSTYAAIQLPITECPAGSDYFTASMFGPGFPADGQLIKGSGLLTEISGTGGKYDLSLTFQDTATDAAAPLEAGGTYRVNTICQEPFGAPVGPSFDAFFTVNSAGPTGTYTAEAPAVPNADTTTTVTVPAGPVVQGSSVAVSAAITGSPSVGTVQFQDNGTDVGAPVAVTSGAANASLTLANAGSRSITAIYSGGTGFNGSTSAPATITVQAPVSATPTTTALVVNPTTGVDTTTSLSLSATVSPAAAGNVVFSNNGVALGDPIPVSNGQAITALTLTQPGTANIVATFVPTTPADFTGSASPTVTFSVAPVAGQPVPDEQTIVVPVAAGQLTISTPYTPQSPLTLAPLALNANATQLSGSAAFEDIVITDTRTGANAWTASANAADLSSGSSLINGQNVGLTGLVPTYTPGNALQAGSVLTVENPAADPAKAPADPGTLGLKGVKTIATAANGLGTVELNGLLTVNAPTSTPAGTYTGIITFTIG